MFSTQIRVVAPSACSASSTSPRASAAPGTLSRPAPTVRRDVRPDRCPRPQPASRRISAGRPPSRGVWSSRPDPGRRACADRVAAPAAVGAVDRQAGSAAADRAAAGSGRPLHSGKISRTSTPSLTPIELVRQRDIGIAVGDHRTKRPSGHVATSIAGTVMVASLARESSCGTRRGSHDSSKRGQGTPPPSGPTPTSADSS